MIYSHIEELVGDRFRTLLSDPHRRIVLPVSKWVMKGCDEDI